MDAQVVFFEPHLNARSVSPVHGSFPLEFVVPSRQGPFISEVSTERNIRPSAHLTEADFIGKSIIYYDTVIFYNYI